MGITLLAGLVIKDVAMPTIAHADGKTWKYVRRDHDCGPGSSSSSSASKGDAIVGIDGDWLTEGSEAYKVAQRVYEILTKDYGTSGEFAAGVLANIKGESNFIPDLGEARYDAGGINRFGMNSKKPTAGMGPSTSTQEASYDRNFFGGGLFQLTKYTKFTDNPKYWQAINKSEGWAPENQVFAMLDLEFWNRSLEHYFFRSHPYDKSSNKITKVEELLSIDDAERAALYFMMSYERPERPHPERLEWAKQANAVFNKSKAKPDKSKWKFNVSADSSIDVSTSGTNKAKSSGCKVDGGGTGYADWGNDGKGTYPADAPRAFGAENIPDSVKQYVLDPRLVGLKLKDSSTWTNPGDQCANFAPSFLYALWLKDGQPNPNAAGPAGEWYGGKFAETYATKYGVKTSSKPSKGAIGSTMGPNSLTPSEWGHVWIVCHVFENGDTLVVEQNFNNGAAKSGYAAGETCTWNYRLIAKAQLDSATVKYSTPADAGYKPNEKILGKTQTSTDNKTATTEEKK